MKPLKPIVYILLLTAFASCNKGITATTEAGDTKESVQNEEVKHEGTRVEGVLRDYTGMDGCGWVIESGENKYQPLNLNEFDIDLTDGNKIKFSFEEVGGTSICMVGKQIRIITMN